MVHTDLRIQRTRLLLRDALIDLLKEMDLEKITVNGLAKKATINRVTFYSHYKDIPDMIDSLVSTMVYELNKAIERQDLVKDNTNLDSMWHPLIYAIEYISSNSEFYKVVLGRKGISQFKLELSRFLRNKIIEGLNKKKKAGAFSNNVDENILIWYDTSALFGVIISWLDNDLPFTPIYLVEQFKLIHLHHKN